MMVIIVYIEIKYSENRLRFEGFLSKDYNNLYTWVLTCILVKKT